MITVSKSMLKAKMLEFFRRVEEDGEDIIVTHNRVPVVKVTSLKPKQPPAKVFAKVRGHVKYHGDILESTIDEWGDI